MTWMTKTFHIAVDLHVQSTTFILHHFKETSPRLLFYRSYALRISENVKKRVPALKNFKCNSKSLFANKNTNASCGRSLQLMKSGNEYLLPLNFRVHLVHNTGKRTTEKACF